MNSKEFTAWLDGFLEGKSKLGKRQIDLIREKKAEVYDAPRSYPYPYPYSYPYYHYYPYSWSNMSGTMSIPCSNATTTTTAVDWGTMPATSGYMQLEICST